jgi:uncharacterized coiled-coil DUF342 family protein
MSPADSDTQVEINSAGEVDTLSQVEERVRRTVELVGTLRQERDAALQALAEARTANANAEAINRGLSDEVATLKSERQQVRGRLERLLGHIDQLNEV